MKKNYLKELGLVILFTFSFVVNAQQTNQIISDTIQIETPVCNIPAIEEVNDFKNARRELVRSRMENQFVTPCSNFVVSFNGFTTEAQEAFQFAVDIWASLIESPVDIRVNANFAPAAPLNLGSASPAFFREFSGGPGNTFADVLYPAALFEKLTGQDSNGPGGASVDINCNFNSIRDDWYFGTDANPPNDRIDFVTVVLHELGHGLGIAGFGTQLNNGEVAIRRNQNGFTISAGSNHASIWDTFIDGSLTNFFGANEIIPILDESEFPDPSTTADDELKFQLEENQRLSINSPGAVNENGGEQPTTQGGFFNQNTGGFEFNAGSSYSHLDESTFNNTPHALMTPFSANGEANHDPGDIILAFMEDMGWTLCAGALSTNDFDLADVVISPNPFTESLTIELPPAINNQEFNITIVDINGRVVLDVEQTANSGEISLTNLSSLRSALYFLNLESTTSDLRITKKLIKQ